MGQRRGLNSGHLNSLGNLGSRSCDIDAFCLDASQEDKGALCSRTVTFARSPRRLPSTPDEAIQEFAQDPMMERVLATLYEQLKRTYDRVMVEMLDRDEALRKIKGEREEVGVQLYGMQQQVSSRRGE